MRPVDRELVISLSRHGIPLLVTQRAHVLWIWVLSLVDSLKTLLAETEEDDS